MTQDNRCEKCGHALTPITFGPDGRICAACHYGLPVVRKTRQRRINDPVLATLAAVLPALP